MHPVKRESWRPPQPTSSWTPTQTIPPRNTNPPGSASGFRPETGSGGENGAGPSRWGTRGGGTGGYGAPDYGRGGAFGPGRGGGRLSPDKWERNHDPQRDGRGGFGPGGPVRGRIPPSGPRDMGTSVGQDDRNGSLGGRISQQQDGERTWGAWREKVEQAESRRDDGPAGPSRGQDRRDSGGWGNDGYDDRRGASGRGGYGSGSGPGPPHGYGGMGAVAMPPSGPRGDRQSASVPTPVPARTGGGGDSWRPDTSSSSSRSIPSDPRRPPPPTAPIRGRGSPDYGVGGGARGRSRSLSRSSSSSPVNRRSQRSVSPRKRNPSITRRSRSRDRDKRMKREDSPYSVSSRRRRSRSRSRESRLDGRRGGDSPGRNPDGMRRWGTGQTSPIAERRGPIEGKARQDRSEPYSSQFELSRQRLSNSQNSDEDRSRHGRSLREQFESNRGTDSRFEGQNQSRGFHGGDPRHGDFTGGPAGPPSPSISIPGRQASLRDQFQSSASRSTHEVYAPAPPIAETQALVSSRDQYVAHPTQSTQRAENTAIDTSFSTTAASSEPAQPIRIAFNASARKSPTKPSSWKTISIPPKSAVSHLFEEPSTPNTLTPDPSVPPSPIVSGDSQGDQAYSRYLSSLPPYLQAAFGEWWGQGHAGKPELRGFLRHYFGREASAGELEMVGKAADLRSRGLLERVVDGQREREREAKSTNGDRFGDEDRDHGRDDGWERGNTGSRRSWKDRNRDDQRERDRERSPVVRNGSGGAGQSANMIPVANGSSRYPRQAPPDPTSAPHSSSDSTPASAIGTAHVPAISPTPLATVPPPQSAVTSPRDTTTPGRSHTELYEKLDCVGEGTYGKVYKARNSANRVFVALKRIRMEGEKDGFPVTAMREIKLLQILTHINVVRLHEMMVSKGSVYMVMEYMDHDLTGLLSHPEITFSAANLKSLNHQMLSGLAYLHANSILHRDMKGSNILLNAKGELKLADFGLARIYAKGRKADYTNRVITLWYRSPELLLGETVYGGEVDCWSAGCIMLELYVTKPVFQGNDEIHQLEVIYSVMGTPSEVDWPGLKELPWYELVKPKEAISSRFRESFKKWLSPAAIDLAEGLLYFDPTRRLTASAALKTPYFTSEEPIMELPSQLAGCGEHHEMSAKMERHKKRQEGRL